MEVRGLRWIGLCMTNSHKQQICRFDVREGRLVLFCCEWLSRGDELTVCHQCMLLLPGIWLFGNVAASI
jgi:hypothetical protein